MRGAAVVVVVVLVVVAGLVGVAVLDPGLLFGARGPGPSPSNATVNSTPSLVSFPSSVDGKTISYAAWYPPGYTPSGTYGFLLFLHGVESTNVCANVASYAGGASMINAALAAGWVVGSDCTRTTDGWYVNSATTGPQETDVLDVIAHEKSVTHVSAVYLVGMSMGSDGALSIATNHPGLFAGVGAVATCADFFEEAAYYMHAHGVLPPGFAAVAGVGATSFPAAGSAGFGLEYRLSAFRFYSQNLSSLRIYVVAGGNDQTCIDNTAFWPWMHANNTVLTSSCDVASVASEPAGCSNPIANLAKGTPGAFLCRFVYEPTAVHTFDQLNGADLVSFFQGAVSTGTYTASEGGPPQPDPSAPQA